MNYPVDVGGSGYVDAVTELASTNRGVIDAINTLTDTLYTCGGMAGNDTGGEAFAKQYDPAASQLVAAGCKLGAAFASMANLLNGSLANHDGAEHGAQMYPGMPSYASGGDTNPDHGTEELYAPAPPSAAGGIGGEPGWWHWIAGHLGGLLWPDADTGKLRSAGSAWITASTTISAYQYSVDSASGAISSETSPEVSDVVAACTEMRGHLTDFATACHEVGQACNDYAKSVDDHHKEIEDQLKSFIEWTAGIEVGGAIVGFFTLGIGEGAAQIAEGAEVANAAEKVILILNDLIEAARGFVTAIKLGISKVAGIVLDLGKFLNAKLITALERTATALADDIPADLKVLEGGGALTPEELDAIGFYTGPGYAQLNSYLRGVVSDVASGAASRAELETYSRLVSQGLDRLPTYTGETLRGTNLPQSVIDEMVRTGKFSDPAFMSTSTSAQIAQDFRGSGNAMLHIEGTTGHDVASLSQYARENEVLFDRATSFDLVKKVWNPRGYWDIYLKETR